MFYDFVSSRILLYNNFKFHKKTKTRSIVNILAIGNKNLQRHVHFVILSKKKKNLVYLSLYT